MKDVQIQILGPRGELVEVQATSQTPSFHERLFKGSKVGLIILGVTCLTVFIPGVHFISVPLGLMLSGYFLFVGMTKSQTLSLPKFSCPVCGKGSVDGRSVTIATASFYLNCPDCNGLLKVKV